MHEANEPDHEIGTNSLSEQGWLKTRLCICKVLQEPTLLTHIQTKSSDVHEEYMKTPAKIQAPEVVKKFMLIIAEYNNHSDWLATIS